ncbi:MAG: PAS domain S-box protein [Gallionella sp.]|nr:PAS domain S-box protein [Gallionella sp.]
MTRLHLNKLLLPLLVLSAGFVATYFLQQAAYTAAHQIQQDNFAYQSREIILSIEQRLKAYEQVLRGAKGLFIASKSVERGEFRNYVTNLELASSYPGIQGVGFSLVIPPHEKTRHIEAIRKEGFPAYTLRPEGERSLYTSIIFLEPFADRNLRAFGYDMYSEAVRRAAMEQARDSGKSSISSKVRLVQETEQDVQSGFLMYIPVYRNGRPHETLADRRANIIGWVYAPFRMNDLMHGILGEKIDNVDFEIFDGKNATPEMLMYDSISGQDQSGAPLYQSSRHIEIFGHNWVVNLHSLPAFEANIDTGRISVIRLTGILMSVLLSLLVWQLATGRARALNRAQEITKELQESEFRWKFALEGAGAGVWDWNISDNTVFYSKFWKEMIGHSADEIGNGLDEFEKRIHPEDKAATFAALQGCLDGKTPLYLSEYRFRCKDGNYIWMFDRGMVISRTEDGKPLRMIGAHTDITGRKQTEAALIEIAAKAKRFADALDSIASSYVYMKDLNHQYFYANQSTLKLFKCSAEELAGSGDARFFPPETVARLKAVDDRVLERGETTMEEIDVSPDSPERRVYLEIKTPIYDGAGKIIGLCGISTDITERKKAEEIVRTAAQYSRSLIEASLDPLVTISAEGKITDANTATENVTGVDRTKLIGSDFADYFTDPGKAREGYQQAFSQGFVTDYPLAISHASGKITDVLYNASVYRDSHGNILGVFAAARDITERKQAEEALRKLSIAVEQSPASVVITDTNACIQYVNPQFTEVTGYSAAEAIGQTPRILQSGKTPKETYVELWSKLTSGQSWHGELLNKRKNGEFYWEDVHIAPVKNPAGIVTHYVAVKTDITDRKEFEEELLRSNAELEQFSYAISHDMRQPLRMISSYLQLIEMNLGGQLDGEKRDYFNFAIEGAKRIDQMLVALLEYSRVGRMGEPLEWIESRAVLDEALQFIQPALDEVQAKLSISGNWPRIFASYDEIQRLIQNLIGNAVKYRIAGRITEIAVTSEIVNNEWRLCVADNGIGIIPGQVKRLFQVFQRLHSHDAYEGTGIGLALCRKIAEHHKGRIWAESAGEGLGSKFCVVLPVRGNN